MLGNRGILSTQGFPDFHRKILDGEGFMQEGCSRFVGALADDCIFRVSRHVNYLEGGAISPKPIDEHDARRDSSGRDAPGNSVQDVRGDDETDAAAVFLCLLFDYWAGMVRLAPKWSR